MMPQRTVLLVLAPIPLALVLSPLGATPGVMWPYIRVLCCTVPYCTVKMGACDPSHVRLWGELTMQPSHADTCSTRHTEADDTDVSSLKHQIVQSSMGNLHNIIIKCSLIFDLNFEHDLTCNRYVYIDIGFLDSCLLRFNHPWNCMRKFTSCPKLF